MKIAITYFRAIGLAIFAILAFSSSALAARVATPTFSPGAGTYTTFQTVTISCATNGATIRYTIDGSTPSSSKGTIYSGPITITVTTTLKAMAYRSNYSDSYVATALYTINLLPVVNPIFTPVAGTYVGSQSIAISTETAGALIRYTLDGSTPTASNGTSYTGPVDITRNLTIKAYASKTGMANSSVVTASYTIKCVEPEFSPLPGTYSGTPTITLSTATAGASIRYTTNGSTPTSTSGTLYSSGITLASSATVKAIAYKTGMANSDVVSGDYVIQSLVDAPDFSPAPGTYNTIQSVSLTSTTLGASIRYTLDGTTPSESTGTVYSSPISIDATTTIKAIAYKAGMTASSVVTGTYTIQLQTVEVPVFSPAGGTFSAQQLVTIASATSGATIRYTIDGSTPSQSAGIVYSSVITVSQNTTIKAIAYKSGMLDSGVITQVYAIRCIEPAFSPAPGTYNAIQSVTLTTTTSGASMRYTTDGTTPTPTSGTEYSAPIPVGTTTTIKAISFKAGMTNSIITSGTFTIQLLLVAAPVFTPAAGTYNSVQSVTIATPTSDASIRFTTDGSTPSPTAGTVYTAALPISTGTNLKAIAYKTGMTESEVSSAQYVLKCATPVFSPAPGSFERPQSVTLSCATPGSAIRYTTNGTTPDATNGTLYSAPVQVNTSLTLKAVAFLAGFDNSDLAEGRYSLGSEDSDGDGVVDFEDEYPTDPLRALNNFFPAAGTGSLAFEDLWPAKGDYDLNDVVVDYSFKTVTNSANKVVETYATFVLRATGATLKNGFGFQFASNAIPASAITVTGMRLNNNYITLASGGTEGNQAIPTFIVFDNAYDILKHPGTGSGINTTPGSPYVDPVTIELHIVYTPNTYAAELLDIEHFNPFIIVNMKRGHEVHLPDYALTSLADVSLFNTNDDNTIPADDRYYKTKKNLPWALNICESFDYPIEKALILDTYLHFGEWSQSGGTLYPDWYKNLPGYRNDANLYKH
ncbi:MAG: chitobiase/beta-hexosaminidase C-terminal domain-containing protein [Bacteroidales bacterium]|jgi:LruC domain-containing protein